MLWIVGNGHGLWLRAVGWGPGHGDATGTGNLEVGCLVLVTVSVTADDDRLGPAWNQAWNVRNNDWLAEHNTVENVSNGSVRRLPHLLQTELGYTSLVWGDGGTLHANAVLLDGVRCVNGHLVVGGVAVLYR